MAPRLTLSLALLTSLQIARISCTTVVCPAGLFVVNEEGGLETAEDYAAPPAREMGATANWSHR